MSEIGEKECKSEIEISYSDLSKLFGSTEPEPIEYFGGKIPCYGKNIFDYKKVITAENNNLETAEKPQTQQESTTVDTARTRKSETEQESVHSEYLKFSDSLFNDDKPKERRDDEMKVIFKKLEFYSGSPHSGEESMSYNGSSINSFDTQETLEQTEKDMCKQAARKPSKVSFFSGLCPSFSMTYSCPRNTTKFLGKDHSIFDIIDLDDCYSVWGYDVPARKLNLDQRLNKDLCDHMKLSVNVCFGKIRFRCHRFVLRSAKLFREWSLKSYIFNADKQFSAIAFSYFYLFAIGLKPRIPSKHLLDVSCAANILDIPELEDYCMKLLDTDFYQENEAFEIYKTASARNSPLIQSLMIQRIFKFFLPLVASNDFIEMNVDDVCCLLESDTIGVNSEIEVFMAAVYWLNSKWKERNEKVLKRVMSCVRYGLLPPWFTYTLKKRTGLMEVDRVVQYKSVSKMIENGASIAATISLFFLDKSKFESILRRVQTKIPKQRHWIYDQNCTYHYGAHEKVSEAVDYRIFKDYLKVLQMEGQNYWCNFREGSSVHFFKIFCQQFLNTTWSKVRY